MAEAANKRIVVKMCELFNLKFTRMQFTKQLGIAKSLLITYSEEDMIDILKYLAVHPPKRGLQSIGYISYIYNEVMPKVTVERLKEVSHIHTSEQQIIEDGNNIAKYNNINKKKMKGIGEF